MNTYSFAFLFTDSFTGCNGEGNWLDQDFWNVETWGCCSSSDPCGVAEGDCDHDDECQGHLLCGTVFFSKSTAVGFKLEQQLF